MEFFSFRATVSFLFLQLLAGREAEQKIERTVRGDEG
jgi:hypothetical protein